MSPVEICPRELARHLENGRPVQLIDVRQPWEHDVARLAGSLLIPLNDLPQRLQEIPSDGASIVILYCHHGVRSLSAATYLHRLGYIHVLSLAGGIDAWSCEVDSDVARY